MICSACQKEIPEGSEIRVEQEKFTPYERTELACSDECAEILRRGY